MRVVRAGGRSADGALSARQEQRRQLEAGKAAAGEGCEEEGEQPLASLRKRFRHLYLYASKMIKLIQSKTPLIVYYSPLARARLMNDGRKGWRAVAALPGLLGTCALAIFLCLLLFLLILILALYRVCSCVSEVA